MNSNALNLLVHSFEETLDKSMVTPPSNRDLLNELECGNFDEDEGCALNSTYYRPYDLNVTAEIRKLENVDSGFLFCRILETELI